MESLPSIVLSVESNDMKMIFTLEHQIEGWAMYDPVHDAKHAQVARAIGPLPVGEWAIAIARIFNVDADGTEVPPWLSYGQMEYTVAFFAADDLQTPHHSFHTRHTVTDALYPRRPESIPCRPRGCQGAPQATLKAADVEISKRKPCDAISFLIGDMRMVISTCTVTTDDGEPLPGCGGRIWAMDYFVMVLPVAMVHEILQGVIV